jgi:MFS family permease
MAGFLILPGSLLAAFVVPVTGRLADIAPPLPMILIGLAIFAASNLLMAEADVNTTFVSVAFYIFVGRFGIAFVAPSMNSAALRALPGEKLNQGAGILNFCFLLGGATGINSLVVVLERRTQFYSDAFAATQTPANAATRELLGYVRKLLGEDGIPEAMQQPVALNYLGEVVQAQADTLGFQDGFLAIAIVTICAMVPAMILGFRRR